MCGIIKDLLERWKSEDDLQAIKDMIQQGTHVEIIEGDVDIFFLLDYKGVWDWLWKKKT